MAIGNPVSLTGNIASKSISVTATAGQTVFTVTGGYRINQISVFRNGTRLVDSLDYTARDGALVTLFSAATLGDVLEFQIFDTFRAADALDVNSGGTVNGNVNITGNLSVTGTTTLSAGSSVSFATTAYNLIGIASTATAAGTAYNLIGIASTATAAGTAYGLSGTPNITVGIISASSLSLTSGSIGFSTYVTLTSGTSWTVPSGVSLIKVYATGGGAGGVFNTGGIYARGGSGATSVRYYIVGSGTTASYAIGAGGLGDSSGYYGAVGGDTTFTYNTVTITGTGGIRANGFPQASQGSGGQINLYGGFASISSLQGYVSGDAPQATGYGLGGAPTGSNGQQGAIIIEY
jgi:hypothetical protein